MTNPDPSELVKLADELIAQNYGNVRDIDTMGEHFALLAKAASALRRLASSDSGVKGEPEPVAWHDGAPPKPWADEWFIAETIYHERVVLRSLPDEYTYDFKTADETYIKADKIKRWMQFPDSEFTVPGATTKSDGGLSTNFNLSDLKTSPELLALIERAKNHVMTPEEIHEQRRSFAKGMCPSHRDYKEWCAQIDKLMPPLRPSDPSSTRSGVPDDRERDYARYGLREEDLP